MIAPAGFSQLFVFGVLITRLLRPSAELLKAGPLQRSAEVTPGSPALRGSASAISIPSE